MVAALVDGNDVLGEEVGDLGGRPAGGCVWVGAAVGDVVALVAGDVLGELGADRPEHRLDVGFVGRFQLAGVLDANTQAAAGAQDDVGLVGLAVVEQQRLGVHDRPCRGFPESLVDLQQPGERGLGHREPQCLVPARAHRFGRHRVGDEQADVDRLRALGGDSPGQQ